MYAIIACCAMLYFKVIQYAGNAATTSDAAVKAWQTVV